METVVCTACDSENVEMQGYKWVDEDTRLEEWVCNDCGEIMTVIDGKPVPERTWKSWWEQD